MTNTQDEREGLAKRIEALATHKMPRTTETLSSGGKDYDLGYVTALQRAADMVRASLHAPDTAGESDFRDHLVASIRAARFTPDALDPKAAAILENVLGRYDATHGSVTEHDKEEEDTYEIGKRDGYSDAVQWIDMRTGGDGEYFASTFPGEGCPGPVEMCERIVERFNALAQSQKTDAAGEAVAWMYSRGGQVPVFSVDRQRYPQSFGYYETPLYATPQAPATDGDAHLIRQLLADMSRESTGTEFDLFWEIIEKIDKGEYRLESPEQRGEG